MVESLTEIYDTLIDKKEITDDILEAFRDIDVMMSVGTFAWMFSTCKEVDEKLMQGETLTYKDKEIDHDGFKKLLTENLSDYCIRQIF